MSCSPNGLEDAVTYHESPDVKAWADAVRVASHRVRVAAFEHHSYAQFWFYWLTRGLGWTEDMTWKWIDEEYGEKLLGVNPGLFAHESPLWYILPFFIDDRINNECPGSSYIVFLGDVESSIQKVLSKNWGDRYYTDEFWREIRSGIEVVAAHWRSVGWNIDKMNLLRRTARGQ